MAIHIHHHIFNIEILQGLDAAKVIGCFVEITQSCSTGTNPYFFVIGNKGIDVAATFFVLVFTAKGVE